MHVFDLADAAGQLIAGGNDLAGLVDHRRIEVHRAAGADVQRGGFDVDDPPPLEVNLVALVGVDRHFARRQRLQAIAAVGDDQRDGVGAVATEKSDDTFGAGQRVTGEAIGFEMLHVVVHFAGGESHLQRLQLGCRIGEHDSAARQQACQ
ncbi:hypothetical protein D3C81_1360590 [compost metagenome]